MNEHRRAEILERVSFIPPDDRQPPQRGTALCLSGGGYRAVLFMSAPWFSRRYSATAAFRRIARWRTIGRW